MVREEGEEVKSKQNHQRSLSTSSQRLLILSERRVALEISRHCSVLVE